MFQGKMENWQEVFREERRSSGRNRGGRPPVTPSLDPDHPPKKPMPWEKGFEAWYFAPSERGLARRWT
jgi:hypothetical protein